MEKDFDLSRVGKRMPYTTPKGFFNQIEDDIWARIGQENAKRRQRKHIFKRLTIGLMGAAACVALLLVVHQPHRDHSASLTPSVEQAFANLSQEDQAYLLEVYQEDVFINE